MTKLAFIFAGQGSQTVGMGKDLAERFPAVRELYARADDALGIPISRLSFEGPQEALLPTDISQPAITLASLAALIALRELHPDLTPACTAGLSLGEYAALVAAGALEELEAVKLVRLRGRLMQEACELAPGTMASVLGLGADDVERIVREVDRPDAPVTVANRNSDKQTVISGERGAVERAGEALKAAGARRVLPLEVAGAYHSPLMASAAAGLGRALAEAPLGPPAIPVLANVTAEPHPADPAAVRGLLERQVTATVRWSDSVAAMRDLGAGAFIELGPGGVLKGILRQIDRDLRCVSLMDAESLEGLDRAELEP